METAKPTTPILETPSPDTLPPLLATLANPQGVSICPRRARWQIDLLMLALESIDLNAAEMMLQAARELNLQVIIPNRVIFWQLRCTNPFRHLAQRHPLSLEEGKALVMIICHVARRQTAVIRHLLLVLPQIQAQNLSPDSYAPLRDYLDRFRRHFRKRMNLRRSSLFIYSDNAELNALGLRLLHQLLICTGTLGMERVWFSLFDGEVN